MLLGLRTEWRGGLGLRLGLRLLSLELGGPALLARGVLERLDLLARAFLRLRAGRPFDERLLEAVIVLRRGCRCARLVLLEQGKIEAFDEDGVFAVAAEVAALFF